MKTRQFGFLLALIVLGSSVFAQNHEFKVLANKGNNEVKSGDTWQPLKTGASLKKEDEVKLGDNSYIGLVHATGKPMELKTAGSYKVSVLAEKIGGGSSVLNKYTDFILSSNSAESKKNRLSATGAVHRAVESAAISLMLPENQHSGIFSSTTTIHWESAKVAGPYIVTIRNMYEDEISKIETPENSVQIDFSDPKLANQENILVEVASKADPKQGSKSHLIKRLPLIDQEKIKISLNEIMADVSDATALNKYILAGFFENNNLYIDAIAAYQEAIKLAPDVTTYKEAYEEFLLRRGLKK
jgi:hypothetical protein